MNGRLHLSIDDIIDLRDFRKKKIVKTDECCTICFRRKFECIHVMKYSKRPNIR